MFTSRIHQTMDEEDIPILLSDSESEATGGDIDINTVRNRLTLSNTVTSDLVNAIQEDYELPRRSQREVNHVFLVLIFVFEIYCYIE